MAHQVQHVVEVYRIERIHEEQVRLTVVPVVDPQMPRPWGERHLVVPVADEVPTGTRFVCTETYSLQEEA